MAPILADLKRSAHMTTQGLTPSAKAKVASAQLADAKTAELIRSAIMPEDEPEEAPDG